MSYFIKKQTGYKGQGTRKYPCKYGHLTMIELKEKTGLSESQMQYRMKFKTVDQILESLEKQENPLAQGSA